MMKRPPDLSPSSRAQSLTARNARHAKFRVLYLMDLLVRTVDKLSIDPIAVHVLAAVLGRGRMKDAGLSLFRQPSSGVAIDRAAATPAQPTPLHSARAPARRNSSRIPTCLMTTHTVERARGRGPNPAAARHREPLSCQQHGRCPLCRGKDSHVCSTDQRIARARSPAIKSP